MGAGGVGWTCYARPTTWYIPNHPFAAGFRMTDIRGSGPEQKGKERGEERGGERGASVSLLRFFFSPHWGEGFRAPGSKGEGGEERKEKKEKKRESWGRANAAETGFPSPF